MIKKNISKQLSRQRNWLIIAVLLLSQISCTADKVQGHFLDTGGQFVNLPIRFKSIGNDSLKLTSNLIFLDKNTKKWEATKGVVSDGASIPAIFVPIIGSKFESNYFNAAVLHDAYCAIDNHHLISYQSEPWGKVHKMFYEATLAGGTDSNKAKIMYAAVYLGGPRWNNPIRDISKVDETDLVQELKWCIQFIEEKNASFEKLNNWMDKREPALITGKPVKPKWAK